jgi:hypothetical protein
VTLHIHIGVHETGAPWLQAFLRDNRGALAGEGYVLPKTGHVRGGHHNIAYELLGKKRFNPEHGSLQAYLEEACAAPHGVISSEEFEFLDLEQVRRFREALDERPARIIVYLRRQDSLIASTYIQQARMGASMPSFEEYLRTCLYNPRFDFPQLLLRWASAFGRDSLEVSVISPETSAPLLVDDFIDRLGLTARRAVLTPTHAVAKAAPGRAHLEIVRRVFAQMTSGRRLSVQGQRRIAAAAEAQITQNPHLRDMGRLEPDAEQWGRVAERFAAGNRWAAREFISVPTVAQALAFDAPPAGQIRGLDHEALNAAVREIVANLELSAAEGPAGAGAGSAA